MSGNKSKKEKKREREATRSEAPGASSAKKAASQGSRTSLSSPASEEAASASPQPTAVVVKNTPPATQRTIKKKIVSYEYGYPIEGQPYRPADEFSEDDDDFAITRKRSEMTRIDELF